jgi:hypothetical protein
MLAKNKINEVKYKTALIVLWIYTGQNNEVKDHDL